MTEELQNPITHLLIRLANSLHERYPDYSIAFKDAEFEIVKDWMIQVGNTPEDQIKLAKIFYSEK